MKVKRNAGAAVFMLIYAAITYYIGWSASAFMQSYHLQTGWIWLPVIFFALSYFAAMGLIRVWDSALIRGVKVVSSFYVAILEYLILLLPAAGLIGLVWNAAGGDSDAYVHAAGWAVLALLAILLIWGSRNAWSPVVREHTIEIAKSVPGRNSIRIMVASDIHLGNIVGNRHLRKLVSKAEQLKPDLILLPGDVIDDSVKPFLRNKMGDTMRGLKAPLGTYAVLGNHEYYGGHIEEYAAAMAQAGIPVLQDELVETGGVFIAGRKDKTAESPAFGGRLTVQELVSGADPSAPLIVMDHQPYAFDKAAAAGADLLLCGHTHRGQFAPNHLVTRRLFELDWGYMIKSRMHVLVSSGFGTWGPPIRLFSRSEILHIKINFV